MNNDQNAQLLHYRDLRIKAMAFAFGISHGYMAEILLKMFVSAASVSPGRLTNQSLAVVSEHLPYQPIQTLKDIFILLDIMDADGVLKLTGLDLNDYDDKENPANAGSDKKGDYMNSS